MPPCCYGKHYLCGTLCCVHDPLRMFCALTEEHLLGFGIFCEIGLFMVGDILRRDSFQRRFQSCEELSAQSNPGKVLRNWRTYLNIFVQKILILLMSNARPKSLSAVKLSAMTSSSVLLSTVLHPDWPGSFTCPSLRFTNVVGGTSYFLAAARMLTCLQIYPPRLWRHYLICY